MPTFSCTTSVNRLTLEQKNALTRLLTTVYSEEFGGPRFVVQVLFYELPEGQRFMNERPSPADNIFIRGEIRAGRTFEQKNNLLKRIITLASKETEIKEFHFSVYLVELAAAAEYGRTVPKLGEEGDLFTAVPQDLIDAYDIRL